MGKRGWLNLALLLVVVALAALVYFEPGKEPSEVVLLTELDAEAVQQIRIERASDDIVLQRRSGVWILVEPQVANAKQFYVNQVLAMLSEQSLERYPAEGLDLNKYGLQPPRAKLVVDGVELAFGRINPLNSRLYVMVDNVIHMVSTNDISLLGEAWHRYVSRVLFSVDDELQSMVVPGLGRLDRDAGGWLFDGAVVPDSADQLQALVDAWQYAQASQVRPVSEPGTAEKVVVRLVSGAEISFGLLATEDELVLQQHELGLEYVFDAAQKNRLLQLPRLTNELVDK